MEVREIEATLHTTACFSEQPAMGNEAETLPYIPGTALRGMLAALYLQSATPDVTFRRIFCDGAVSFPNLYPTNARPLPLSAYTCKPHFGFRSDPTDQYGEPPHGVVDLLFEDFLDNPSRRCPWCKHPLAPYEVRFYDGGTVRPKRIPVEPLIRMRTAVSPRTRSALRGALYSQTELPAESAFRGMLIATDANALEALIQVLGNQFTGWTGRRRAGKLEVIFNPASPPSKPKFLPWPTEDGWHFIALTLVSDAILIDRMLRPLITLTSEVLYEYLDFPTGVEVQVVKAFRAVRRVAGWSSVGKIFKPDDLALAAGSTFLLKVAADGASNVLDWMHRLTMEGIGLRRSEGFGRVVFDEPLHLATSRKGMEGRGGEPL